MSRSAYLAATLVLCLVAAAGIVGVLIADSFLAELNMAYTAAAVLVFGTVVAIGVSATGAYRWVGWLAAGAAVAAFGFMMGALWSVDEFGDSNSETLYELFGCFGVFSFALGYAAVVLRRTRADDSGLVTGLTIATLLGALAVATLATIAILGAAGDVTYWRIVAVVAVLGALAGSLVPLSRAAREP